MTNIQTSEFYLAAWLYMKQVPMIGHTRESNRSVFTFQSDDIDQLITEFYSETATVSVHPFTRAQREIKAIMYSETTIQSHNNNNDKYKKGAI
ncbi:MAG: hypothetical protein H8D23_27500 [Candidatus Brocadiales bacterium]|nr:hypothetical protein [Candidatus Brocadiales bacterium]